jgi:GTP-binding protein EngB required for normal cell division
VAHRDNLQKPSLSNLSSLTDNHRRGILSGLSYLERLLVDSETILNSASTFSLSRNKSDVSPIQRQVSLDYIARIRDRMEEVVRLVGLTPPEARTGKRWEIQVTLLSAEIAIEEISPKSLIGYGKLDSTTSESLDRILTDLTRLFQQLRRYLSKDSTDDLEARIARLGQSPVDRTMLGRLERVISHQGFIEFRPQLESLLEGVEDQTFEIAVFGRVSSGKSSLLNAVLDFEVLPIGVTPVTAVPTRLIFGAVPQATIRFAEKSEQRIEIKGLSEFVTESGNPENKKHVVRVTVEIPSPHLKSGIAFVDTPGVGSLALSGARESYSYLPRCDLGILLIDSTSAPNRDDLEILRLFHDSGVSSMVLLTKTDLLKGSERDQMQTYVRKEVAKLLGASQPVFCVSTVDGDAELAKKWFHEEIAPLFEKARELRQASLRRKFETIRAAVTSALKAALKAGQSTSTVSTNQYEIVQQLALEAEGVLQHAGKNCVAHLETAQNCFLDAAKGNLLETAQITMTPERMTQALRQKLISTGEFFYQRIYTEITQAQKRLVQILGKMQETSTLAPSLEELRIDVLSRPEFVLPQEVEKYQFRITFPLKYMPFLLRYNIERAFKRELENPLRKAVTHYASQLRDWTGRSLERFSQQFRTQAEPIRAQSSRLAGGGAKVGDRTQAEQDLAELEAGDSTI